MTRKECLDEAARCVLQDRNSSYGGPENSFGVIANFWSVYLGRNVYPHDVAMMMALLKIARIKGNKGYADGYIDLAGYAACGAELAGRAEAYRQSIEKAGAEYKRLRAEAEGDAKSEEDKRNPLSFEEQAKTFARENPPEEPEGNHPENPDSSKRTEGCEEPAYNPDNDVVGGVVTLEWPRGKLLEKRYASGRDEKCAEGCEDLVQKDAPQTAQELYQHIVDSNPATYKAHKPTGEELAEMAEEEGR